MGVFDKIGSNYAVLPSGCTEVDVVPPVVDVLDFVHLLLNLDCVGSFWRASFILPDSSHAFYVCWEIVASSVIEIDF